MVPMITAPKGETMSQPAVMPTNPARMPFSVRDKEGLPYFIQLTANAKKPPAQAAKLTDVIDNGAPLDRSIADEVAAGMKKWAVEMGATHYTHWFHPLTEGTATTTGFFLNAVSTTLNLNFDIIP